MSRHAHEIEKLCMFFDSTEKTAAALPKFQAIPGVAVVQGSPDNIEVTAAGVDKGSALLALADLLGIPHENTLAVGRQRERPRHAGKGRGSPLLWPTECPRSRPLAAL